MTLAYPFQRFQDWFTQQWVILRGRKIDPGAFSWLIGPFGELHGIGLDVVYQLAEKESLQVVRNAGSKGLIKPLDSLKLSESEMARLSAMVVDFYEHTSKYDLRFSVRWNPVYKVFGRLVNGLFSNRIRQLNIPTTDIPEGETITSEIITLVNPETDAVKYTFWYRTMASTGKVVYSGVYGVCALPSGKSCVRAVFPLPKGNATVILSPGVGEDGSLVLDASGTGFGDAGFYFLLVDAKGNHWVQYIRSFRDRLVVRPDADGLAAEQMLTLWNRQVVMMSYRIRSAVNTDGKTPAP